MTCHQHWICMKNANNFHYSVTYQIVESYRAEKPQSIPFSDVSGGETSDQHCSRVLQSCGFELPKLSCKAVVRKRLHVSLCPPGAIHSDPLAGWVHLEPPRTGRAIVGGRVSPLDKAAVERWLNWSHRLRQDESEARDHWCSFWIEATFAYCYQISCTTGEQIRGITPPFEYSIMALNYSRVNSSAQ
jgi:hypothetical protein